MRKILIISFLTFLFATSVSAASDEQNPFKKMAASHKELAEYSSGMANNFRYDYRFAGYLRGRAIMFQANRQKLIDIIFPVTNKNDKEYAQMYPYLVSDFAIKMNNKEKEELKSVAQEYCKYSTYKPKQKAQACSQF